MSDVLKNIWLNGLNKSSPDNFNLSGLLLLCKIFIRLLLKGFLRV